MATPGSGMTPRACPFLLSQCVSGGHPEDGLVKTLYITQSVVEGAAAAEKTQSLTSVPCKPGTIGKLWRITKKTCIWMQTFFRGKLPSPAVCFGTEASSFACLPSCTRHPKPRCIYRCLAKYNAFYSAVLHRNSICN